MAYKDAYDFFIKEISVPGFKYNFPIKYDLNQGDKPGSSFFRVVILWVPPGEQRLHEVSKKAHRLDGTDQTISFAPTGGCPCCGR